MCIATKTAVQELMISNCDLSLRVDSLESKLNNLSSEIQDCCEDLREKSRTEGLENIEDIFKPGLVIRNTRVILRLGGIVSYVCWEVHYGIH